MPNRKKSPQNKRSREVKIALTEAEYQQIVEWASEMGYAPSVFARLAVLGTMPKVLSFDPQVWNEIGHRLKNLDRVLEVLDYVETKAIAPPISLQLLLKQELLKLRQTCASLLKSPSQVKRDEA